MGNLILVPDRNMFKILIENDLDIKLLEKIEGSIGRLAISESVESGIRADLERLEPARGLAWRTYIKPRVSYMIRLLQAQGQSLSVARSQLADLVQIIQRAVISIAGGIEREDLELIAACHWIRERTQNEPVVISEDKDLLIFLQLVAGFLGLSLGAISFFEALRLSGADSEIPAYCHHYNLTPPSFSLSSTEFGPRFGSELTDWIKNGRLAVHPRLHSNDSLSRITR